MARAGTLEASRPAQPHDRIELRSIERLLDDPDQRRRISKCVPAPKPDRLGHPNIGEAPGIVWSDPWPLPLDRPVDGPSEWSPVIRPEPAIDHLLRPDQDPPLDRSHRSPDRALLRRYRQHQ